MRLAACIACLFEMLGSHGVPGEKVEQLVRQIEVPASGDFAARDQHDIQFRQPARCSQDPPRCVDHENQDPQGSFHRLSQAHGGYRPWIHVAREPLARVDRILEARCLAQRERAPQQRCLLSDLGSQSAVCRDPSAGVYARTRRACLAPHRSVARRTGPPRRAGTDP